MAARIRKPDAAMMKTVARMRKSDTAMMKTGRVLLYAFLIIITVITVMPLWITVVNATRSNGEIMLGSSFIPGNDLQNNWNHIVNYGLNPVRIAWNSMFIASMCSFITLYVCCMMAYSITVYSYRLRTFYSSFVLAVMMVPSGMMLIGLYKMLHAMGMMNNQWSMILYAVASPNCVYFMRQYMRGALPLEIIDSGRIDGAGEFSIFNIISLPLLMPAVCTQLIFTFVTSWNNWLIPSLIISDVSKITVPIMVGLLRDNQYSSEMGSQFLGLAVAVIPVTIIYTILSRFIIEGIALGSIKG